MRLFPYPADAGEIFRVDDHPPYVAELKRLGMTQSPQPSYGKCECETVMSVLLAICWKKNAWVGVSCRDLDDFIQPSGRIRDRVRQSLPRWMGLSLFNAGRLPQIPSDGEPVQVFSGALGNMRNISCIGSFSVFTVVGIRLLEEHEAVLVRRLHNEDVVFPHPELIHNLRKKAREQAAA